MTDNKIKLLVGLGNPGKEYDRTRHNVGFWFLQSFANLHKANFETGKFFGLETKILIGNSSLRLLMPSTFMNLSGKSVAALANFYKIPANQILVVHDELDLPVGTARFKQGGGTGGHNGLSDIVTKLGNNKNFARLRLGIGKPQHKNTVSYVLGIPTTTEFDLIQQSIDASLNVLPDFLQGDFAQAMQKLHTKN